MFIPVDRLYDFLDQFVSDDVIIYRFWPNGSRKFVDIMKLREYGRQWANWYDFMKSMVMLMHDQEPLDFDLYKNIDPIDVLRFLEQDRPETFKILQKYNLLDYMGETGRYNNLEFSKGYYISDRWLLCHSELNSSELHKYEQLGAVGIYWWSHAMIARDWYRYAQVDSRLDYINCDFQKDFNIYNRAWSGSREYRLKFSEMVIGNDLLPYTSINFSEHDNGEHYLNHKFKNSAFRVNIDLSVLPPNQCDSSASADYSHQDYLTSAIDVVLETLFDDARIHLTEKTLRPIACGKPFILVSTAGSLKYLQNYGFRTFDNYIDESYDTIKDPLDRLNSVIELMKDIANLSQPKKHKLYQQLHAVAQHNQKWFWSNEFADSIIGEFKNNLQQSYAICKSTQHGKKWLDHRKALSKISDGYRKWLCSDSGMRTRQDQVNLLMSIKLNQVT